MFYEKDAIPVHLAVQICLFPIKLWKNENITHFTIIILDSLQPTHNAQRITYNAQRM